MTPVFLPCHGFLLRWTYTALGFARIGVQVRPMDHHDNPQQQTQATDAAVTITPPSGRASLVRKKTNNLKLKTEIVLQYK